MGQITKATFYFNSQKVRPTPREGDIKITSKGVYERRHRTTKCGHLRGNIVSNGRYVFDWIRIGDAPPEHKGRPVYRYRDR